MHKCFRCGTEFEGGYCPECGTSWQEQKHCPNCGAMLAGSAKFCNNCGYSFIETAKKKEKQPSKIGAFFSKTWKWIKSHLKIVIPTAIALVVVIVILSLIPTFIVASVNGTYYAYSIGEDDELVFSEKTFITLSTGKWKDSDGMEGKYKVSGSNVTLIYEDKAAEELGDMLGELGGGKVETTVEMKGTVKNGILTIIEDKHEQSFAKKNHKHSFDEATCACGLKWNYTEGLEYEKKSGSYTVSGIGTATVTDIIIPPTYKGKSVTAIGDYAFEDCSALTSVKIPNSVTRIGFMAFAKCSSLTSITIPKSVTSIGDMAFADCSSLAEITLPNSVTSIGSRAFMNCRSLTRITFNGTKAQWEAIEKTDDWNGNTGNYTVQCDDGELNKAGEEIE